MSFNGDTGTAWCTANDPNYPSDGSTDGQSVHCAAEHFLWHIGQAFVLIAYFCGSINIAHAQRRYQHVGYFRGFLALSSLVLLVWAASFGEASDQMYYYVGFFLVNLIHLFIVLFYEKDIELNVHLDTLWKKMFNIRGYNLEKIDFYNLVQEKALLTLYKKEHVYITEGDIPCQLSILLSGKMSIWKNDSYQRKNVYMSHHSTHAERTLENKKLGEGKASSDAYCGCIYPHEFIDSYEWLMSQGSYVNSSIGSTGPQTSQVTIVPVEECLVLTWKKELLEAVFKQHPRLRVCIHALVGKDIAEKMLRITGHSTNSVNPEAHLVRKAKGYTDWSLGADVMHWGKGKDPHTDSLSSRYDASELAANVFDEHVDQHNCINGTYTWFPGEIFEQGEGDEEVMVKWQDGTTESVGVDKLRKVCVKYSGYDANGVPTKDAHGTPLQPDQINRLKLEMTSGSGYGHERLFETGNLTFNSATEALMGPTKAVSRTCLSIPNLGPAQLAIKSAIGAGPWCELSNKELSEAPWTNVIGFDAQKQPVKGIPAPGNMNYHLLQQAQHSLQRSRLRITNSRLLGINPGALESLQPSSDSSDQDKLHGAQLLRYFEENTPDLLKKDLHEILKWGKWRSYYRPGTVLVRQGEEAHYMGIILQGRLAMYTEDEMTRYKSLASYAEKFDLVGSEDFSSKFRTARRTIQMPRHVSYEEAEGQVPPQVLPKCPVTNRPISPTDPAGDVAKGEASWAECSMYEDMHIAGDATASDSVQKYLSECHFSAGEKEYLLERIKAAEEQGEETLTVTKIPTVMFTWDIKDLKRLMLADPKVEASLSGLLRSDITFKLNTSSVTALGTRVCGVPTNARGDTDVRMCTASTE